MGSVYEASHTRVDRLFAIKVLNVRMAKDKEAMARFEREAMLGSRLGHDHIVSVIDFDYTKQGFPFLVMERLKGQDLSRELRSGAFALERAASVVRQVGVALAAAHAEGVVHRDLKPENIFLCTRQGGGEQVKVMDFGISKVLTSDSIKTSHAAILGTPWYMAPEQAEGKVEKIDHRSDIFALGAIFYHMLAGIMPFGGDNVPSVLFQVVHGEPKPLHEHCPGLPLEVVNLVKKAMNKRRSDRFNSAVELVDQLAEVLGDSWTDVLIYESGAGRNMTGAPSQIRPGGGDGDENDIALSGTISVSMAATAGAVDGVAPDPLRPADLPDDLGTAATVAGDMASPHDSVGEMGEISPAGVLDSMRQKDQPTRPRTTLSRGSGEVTLDAPLANVQAPAPSRRIKGLAMAAGIMLVASLGVALYFQKEGPPISGEQAPRTATLETTTAGRGPAVAPAPAGGEVKPAPAPEVKPGAGGEVPAVAEVKPAPAPAPAAGTDPLVVLETRSLTVRSRPRGARVKAGGKYVGKTPLDNQIILQKAMKVEIKRRGYAEVVKTLRRGADPVELTVTLRALPATINVVALHRGKPVEADIYLNGRKVDQTPAELSNLKPGRYTLRLQCKGFKPVIKHLTLGPGRRGRMAVGMVRR